MPPEQGRVTIHYRRPPDRLQLFEQRVVEETPECTVTYLPAAELARPVVAGGRVILEPGSPVVWFTYPEKWHDIGRFHLASGEFTGVYANILTPVAMEGRRWETTDLFLDVWIPADGAAPCLLDAEELREAVERGWVDSPMAERARREAAWLMEEAKAGRWPPRQVAEWTLERVREALSSC